MSGSTPSVRRVIGRYALYDRIASGGMATVHLGRLLGPVGFARTVAIKRLHPQFAGDPDFVSMFLDEARLVARISHPNVVPTLDVVNLEDELFIVMEYVRGEALSRLVRTSIIEGSPIPPATVATLLVGVLHGLHAAHEARSEQGVPLGIVHRDVSPHNILVGVDGVPRVLDFGVAKAAGRLQNTREGELKGKVGYMAPEQIRGEVSRVTDVYAASVVLWEALTLRRLFSGDSDARVLDQVLAGAKARPSEHARGIPAALDAVTMRGLALDPAERYATAREMALALQETVPHVASSTIGEWVEATAKKDLDVRSDRIAAIESESTLPPDPGTIAEGPSRKKASAPTTASRRRRAVLGLGIALALCLGGALAFRASRRAHAELAAHDARSGAVPSDAAVDEDTGAARATTLTDLPLPETRVPEAAAEYAAGMQALHDNSWSLARQHFERTVALDPTLAVAHLRMAMTTLVLSSDPVRRRQEFASAAALRAQLTPRDLVLLEALEPVLQWVRDGRAEAGARVERATRTYPRDVELLDWLGFLRDGDPARALEPLERAIALDPKDGQAWQTKGHCLALLDRLPEARAAFDACADLALDSSDCLLSLSRIDAIEGKCGAFESDARRMFDRDPLGAFTLATAVLAKGSPAAALDVFDEGLVTEPDAARRAIFKSRFRTAVALYAGDFARAADLARKDLASVSSSAALRYDYGLELRVTNALVLALEEMGKDDEVRKVAAEFVTHSEGWAPHSFAKGLDLSLFFLRLTEGKAGVSPEELERRRAAWIEQRLTTSGAYPGLVWTFAYGATALTPDDAQAAVAALPKFAPLSPFWLGSASPDAYAGEVFRLAGKTAEAIPYLQRAVANCNDPVEPWVAMPATLHLGMALEATDKAAACAAYQRVLDRWGHATPRSVTAEKARERSRALGCVK